MNDDTAEIEANLDNAYQAGIRDGRKLERERIAAAIEAGVLPSHPNRGFRDGMHRAALVAREPS